MCAAAVTVRRARPEDSAALAALVAELARYEGKAELAHLTPEWVEGWAFGPDPAFEALLAELDGTPVGYLAFYRAFSFFAGGPVLLVENLFVTDAARGRGAGRALLAAAAGEAVARGWPRLELNVRADNPLASRFYERLDFTAPGEAVYRVDHGALARLAARAGPVG